VVCVNYLSTAIVLYYVESKWLINGTFQIRLKLDADGDNQSIT